MPHHSKLRPQDPAASEKGYGPVSTLRYFAPMYVVVVLAIALAVYFLGRFEREDCYNEIKIDGQKKINTQRSSISRTFQILISDMRFLLRPKAHPLFGGQGQVPDTPERREAVEAVERDIAARRQREIEAERAKVEKLRGPVGNRTRKFNPH